MGMDNVVLAALLVAYGLGEWVKHIYHQDDPPR